MSPTEFEYEGKFLAERRAGRITANSLEQARKKLLMEGFSELEVAVASDVRRSSASRRPVRAALLAVLILILVLASSYAVWRYSVPAPPDMSVIYSRLDQAVDSVDAEARFADYADKVEHSDLQGRVNVLNKSEQARFFLEMFKGLDKDGKAQQNSQILGQQWEGADYRVVVKHDLRYAKRSGFSSWSVKQTTSYLWRRFGKVWKIVAIKEVEGSASR